MSPDVAALDTLVDDPGLLAPIAAAWVAEHCDRGRQSIAMDRFGPVDDREGPAWATLVR